MRFAAAASLFCSVVFLSPALAETVKAKTTRISQTSDASPANAESFLAEISGNGKWVAYMSEATNIEGSESLGFSDVFLRRAASSATSSRISESNQGAEGDGDSRTKAISKTGRYVLFNGQASNLASTDANGSGYDTFLYDRNENVLQQVSLDSNGAGASSHTYGYDISNDARYVLLGSYADDFAPGDSNGVLDTFLRDRQTGETELVTVDSDENQVVAPLYNSHLSENGRYVIFSSEGVYASGDDNTRLDVYVRDMKKGTTELAVYGLSGVLPNAPVDVYDITPDARFLLIGSRASNLDTRGNAGNIAHLYRYDRKRRKAIRVTMGTSGESANGDSEYGSMSDNGHYVAFESNATNLVEGDDNGTYDIFLRRLKHKK